MKPATPVARLHLNEAAFEPAPAVQAAVSAAIASVNAYPGMGGAQVGAALAERLGWPAERITIGNGSDELLCLAASAFVGPDRGLVWPCPGFARYASMPAIGGCAQSQAIPLASDGANDLAAMRDACASDGSSVAIIASPNNPTGTPAAASAIDAFLTNRPPGTLVIVDDAYSEFARLDGHADLLERLRRDPGPWLLMRTFSKAYAIAGLRVGYALASHRQFTDSLAAVRPTFNVNALAEAAALAALRCDDWMIEQVTACIGERNWLRQSLAELGYACPASATNFLAVNMGDVVTARRIRDALAKAQILVAGIDDPRWSGHLRISIAGRAEHERLLAVLRDHTP